jgi:hypothetical protein
VLRWYFAFRLLTFVFVIIGGTLIDSSDSFLDDPIGFLKMMADNVAESSAFFISYVIVAGGLQIFFRLSQLHNLLLYWFVRKILREESVPQRRLDRLETTLKIFHLDEFIPLFIFIFMVGAIYCVLAPLAGLFVALFFKCAYHVFKYMTLYIYGNQYEGGGFLFYTLSTILLYVLYFLIAIVAGYLSLHGSNYLAVLFSLIFIVVVRVHRGIYQTFVEPSKTLSLSKARVFDEKQDHRSPSHFRAKCNSDKLKERSESQDEVDEVMKRLLTEQRVEDEDDATEGDSKESTDMSNAAGLSDSERRRHAIERLQQRYQEDDSFSDFTDSEASGPRQNFFIYRQPSLNRATWECAPRPYRESMKRRDTAEVCF